MSNINFASPRYEIRPKMFDFLQTLLLLLYWESTGKDTYSYCHAHKPLNGLFLAHRCGFYIFYLLGGKREREKSHLLVYSLKALKIHKKMQEFNMDLPNGLRGQTHLCFHVLCHR